MKLLLDTSTFLWYITGDLRLPEAVRAAVQNADNDVRLSVVSVWEITVKYQLGRLVLPDAPSVYVSAQRQRHEIAPLPLEEAAVVHLPQLPEVHRDPFDRMLVCQAIEHQLAIASADQMIRRYPVRVFWPGR